MSKKKNTYTPILLVVIFIGILISLGGYIYYNNSNTIDIDDPRMPKVHAQELTDLILLQQEKGIAEILQVDCENVQDTQAKQYCTEQTKMVQEIMNYNQ